MNSRNTEIAKFLVVGGVTFFLDYGLLYVFTEYVGCNYLISTAIAFVTAVIANYLLCLSFVFKNSKNGVVQIIFFISTSIVGLILNQLCMWLFVEVLGVYYMLAKVFSTALVTVWNYVTKKKALEG